MVKIGSYALDTNILLAPMAGCTDLAFRLIAREEGARFCFFEMIDANSAVRNRANTFSMLKTHALDKPIAVQLLGNDPDMMLKAAQNVLEAVNVAFLDVNAACPAKKVVKKRAGACLLRDSYKLFAIIKKLAGTLTVPITVKLRTGHENETLQDIVHVARGCESSGASALFVHGRTRLQGYSGEIDYDTIREMKSSVQIPVFGSGNVFSVEHAKQMFDRTSCDGILVARGALGNPWIFRELESYFKDGSVTAPADNPTKKMVLKRHLTYIETHNDCSRRGKVGVMRKVAMWYTRSFPNARRARQEISVVKSCEKMLELVDAL